MITEEKKTVRTFPVLWQGSREYMKALADAECPRSVPWDFVAAHREQCVQNHSQSPERLAERHGLSPEEMLAVIRGTPLHLAQTFEYWHDPKLAVALLKDAVAKWTAGRNAAEAVAAAGFRVAPNLLGDPTLWCLECGRDSGFHHESCSKRG